MALVMASPDTKHVPQGSLELLKTDVAQRLLHSTELARVAYTASDGTPRVYPTWFQWTGDAFVTATMARSATGRRAGRLGALQANPAVAVTIDTREPLEVLLLRGRVEISEVDGVAPEYAWCARHYWGEEAGGGFIAGLEQSDIRMARITLRPSWVGLLDFRTRFPRQMEG
ncbi:MAG TPA: pyridoxamine 5'-phosphate oxidase family protein [Candidatus Limnocylindrales bacterium]